MKLNIELKKFITFGAITGLTTSAYMTFWVTGVRQGFFTHGFLINWVKLIPVSYMLVLPFLMITAPFIRKFVDKLFDRNIL